MTNDKVTLSQLESFLLGATWSPVIAAPIASKLPSTPFLQERVMRATRPASAPEPALYRRLSGLRITRLAARLMVVVVVNPTRLV